MRELLLTMLSGDWGFGADKGLALTHCAVVWIGLTIKSPIGYGADVSASRPRDSSVIRNST
jgi:hypothetical protein